MLTRAVKVDTNCDDKPLVPQISACRPGGKFTLLDLPGRQVNKLKACTLTNECRGFGALNRKPKLRIDLTDARLQ